MIEKANRVTRDIDQERAAYAWKNVLGCDDKYANLAKSAPALIMNNGLMQTLAFYKAKGKDKKDDHHTNLLEHVCVWLCKCGYGSQGDSSFGSVMKALYESPESVRYRRATEEALGLLRWIRQFASALVKDKE